MTNEEYFEQMFPSLVNADAFTIGNRRFVSMDKVLETIDTKIRDSVSNTEYIEESETPIYKALMELRAEYLALKGGEQE